MSAFLYIYVAQRQKRIPIDDDLFASLRLAKDVLIAQHAIEARFNNIFENYIALETCLANLLATHTLRYSNIFDPADETHSTIARFLSNLLSSASAYRSQVARYKIGSRRSNMQSIFDTQKQSSPHYRAAEALRNYDQHYSLLVHQYSLPIQWTDDRTKRRHGLSPGIALSELLPGIRSTDNVLQDLKTMTVDGELIPLMPLMRKYIEQLSEIHQKVRDALASGFTSAVDSVQRSQQIAISAGAKGTTIITAANFDNNGIEEERFHVQDKLIVSIKAFRKLNQVTQVNFGLVEFFL